MLRYSIRQTTGFLEHTHPHRCLMFSQVQQGTNCAKKCRRRFESLRDQPLAAPHTIVMSSLLVCRKLMALAYILQHIFPDAIPYQCATHARGVSQASDAPTNTFAQFSLRKRKDTSIQHSVNTFAGYSS
jgi:hypothetical protein